MTKMKPKTRVGKPSAATKARPVTMRRRRNPAKSVSAKIAAQSPSQPVLATPLPTLDPAQELSAEGRALLTNSEWVELFPAGISVSSAMGRPVLILKDKYGVEVLPVWVQPLDAGVALAELSQGSGATPHAVTRRLMQALGMKLESCTFVDLVGHHQFVQLNFEGNETVKSFRLRADEAMSFCLQSRARFYSTRTYMARCRDVDEDLARLEQGLSEGTLPGLQAEMEISSKKHPYVM